MELSTQCPQCGTVFPATLEQLQLRKGYIRCVNCAHIFDGYEAVVASEPAAGPEGSAPIPAAAAASRPAVPARTPAPERPQMPGPASEPAQPVAPAPAPATMPSVLRQRPAGRAGDTAQREPAAAPDSGFRVRIPDADDPDEGPRFTLSSTRLPPRQRPEPLLPGGAGEPAADPDMSIPDAGEQGVAQWGAAQRGAAQRNAAQRDADAWAEPVQDRPAVYADSGRVHEDRPGVYIEPRRGDEAESLPEFLETRDRRWRGALRVFWGVLSLFGLAVLLAQLAYVYRGQIADHSPELRPLLQQACVSLKCDVPYARRILLIAITNSSLRALPAGEASAGDRSADGKNDSSRMLLQLTLRNNDSRAQEWPTLTLDLVDFSGAVVSKKNLSPSEYLPQGLRGSPFAAHSEVALAIPLTVTGYHVNGYQLGKFFP